MQLTKNVRPWYVLSYLMTLYLLLVAIAGKLEKFPLRGIIFLITLTLICYGGAAITYLLKKKGENRGSK